MAGRNDPCPCGSGKKYKRCHGADAPAPAQAASAAQRSGFAYAHQLFTARLYPEAQRVCEAALQAQPRNLDGWFLSAAIALEQRNYEHALGAMQRAGALEPRRAEVQFNIGHIYDMWGDAPRAAAAYRAATQLKPDYAQAWNNLGNAARAAGRGAEAIAAYREGARLTPKAASAWNNLGVALRAAGQLEESAACYRRALDCDTRYAPAHNNLGNLLAAQSDYAPAEAALREALRLDPRFADAHVNLAGLLRNTGRFEAALASYREAVQLQPDNQAAWAAFAAGLQGLRFSEDDVQARRELVRALEVPTVDPLMLVPAAISLLKCAPVLRALIGSATVPALDQMGPLFGDALLGALLETAVLADWELEDALRRVRAALLDAAADGVPLPEAARAFAARLAHQCWLTEYVARETADETAQVAALQAMILRGPAAAANGGGLAVYACYRPLLGLGDALAALPAVSSAAPALAALLALQVEAPREEARLRAGLHRLGGITDEVSRAVQAQYEEHPYPRWERVGIPAPRSLLQVAQAAAPRVAVPTQIDVQNPQVLVAGCGTGRHPLQTATRIAGAQVLAVDLSAASLAYALRKAQELGVANMEFMQADILELGLLGRRFDLIESFGVLHHMRDPQAGWRVLTDLLKPGGLMMIGLYSERARAPVVACRDFVSARGYANTAADIRRFRQDFVREGLPAMVAKIQASPDFYSISDCRDLIFHVQEHRYTLPQIGAMAVELGLTCLGVELDDPALYAAFPGESAQLPEPADLDGWDRFEQQNPDAFGSTYRIWWQKQ